MIVAGLWSRFRAAIYVGLMPDRERELRLAFYSGGQAVLNMTLEKMTENGANFEPEVLDFFRQLSDEFSAFGTTLFEDGS